VFARKVRALRDASLLITISILYSANTFAERTPNLAEPKIVVPEKIAGVTTVDAEQVIRILAADNPPILIDARIKEDRSYGFIESSISLPDIKTNCESLKNIIADKKQALIFYCNGVQCGRSVVAIKVARSCGYHNLTWFRGGFSEWKDKGYPYIQRN
jgi:rhodanese-related sulfurtransferase